MSAAPSPTIALLPWGNTIEDYLDPIGLSLDAFCERMTGGWLFGYVDALRLAGWGVTLVCVSRDATAPVRRAHAPSGAPVWVLPSAAAYRRLARRMRDPHAWSLDDAFAAPPRHGGRALRDLAGYLATPPFALARALRFEGCTAVLVQEYEYARFDVVVLLGRLLRLPVYASFQGGDGHAPGLEDWLRPPALRRAAGLAVATADEARRIEGRYGVAPERIRRVQNPVDLVLWRPDDRAGTRAALGVPDTARLAICHGRIEMRSKGLDVLLAAWARLAVGGSDRDWRLLLVGAGSDDTWLRARLAEPAFAGVRWIDRYELDRAAMRRYLSAADVSVLPSRLEGLPVAPLEAMACGLPVVASDIPAMRNILEHGLDSGGMTVPAGDAEALARALGRFLDDPALSRATGERARRCVESRFSPAAVAAQLAAMLAHR